MQSSSVPAVAPESSSLLSGPQSRQAFELVESCFAQIAEQHRIEPAEEELSFPDGVAEAMLEGLDDVEGITNVADSRPVH